MSLIKNLVKESDVKPNKKSKNKDGSGNDSDDEKKARPIIKSALDLQRLKLEKLMKNPVGFVYVLFCISNVLNLNLTRTNL